MNSPQWNFSRKKSPSSHGATHTTAAQGRLREPSPRRRRVLLVHHDAWREAADDVEAASRRWRAAALADRADAAVAFSAALEREEKAASAYQLAWEEW